MDAIIKILNCIHLISSSPQKFFQNSALKAGRRINRTHYGTIMSFGKQAACIGSFYSLLKEIALFISNKKPIKAEELIIFVQDQDSLDCICLFLV